MTAYQPADSAMAGELMHGVERKALPIRPRASKLSARTAVILRVFVVLPALRQAR
jgi:hypothetical protein